MTAAATVEETREALKYDTPFYAENFCKIVDKRRRKVPLVPRPAQLKLDAALEAQRAAGLPMRVIILKARQLGFSTWIQAKGMQRVTQSSFHKFVVVAHDKKTGGQLYGIGERIYANLPADPSLGIKPQVSNLSRSQEMIFGEASRKKRLAGEMGLESAYVVDTANEVEAGRGFTYHTLHLSEVAFWAQIVTKMTALMQTVPDDPDTLVAIESTANGHNEFKAMWDAAVRGDSEFVAVFCGWHEDPDYQRPFVNDEEREDFIADIGVGELAGADPDIAEAEPMLVERFGCTPEQLKWRRWAIQNKTGGDLRAFNQEYPATPEDAFLATGATVFSMTYVQSAIGRAEAAEPDMVRGVLQDTATRRVESRNTVIEVPKRVLWVPDQVGMGRGDRWKVWEFPDPGQEEDEARGLEERPPGQYVIGSDIAAGEDQTFEESAYHTIQVVNHVTGEQAAAFRSRKDPDLMAWDILRAALFWNMAWIAVEITGSWGLPVIKRIYYDFGWRRVYMRRSLDRAKTSMDDRLGFDSNPQAKALIEDYMREGLRTATDGIRDVETAREMVTFIRNKRGKSTPEKGSFSDLLMAYMIARWVATQLRPRRPGKTGGVVSTTGPANPTTGY